MKERSFVFCFCSFEGISIVPFSNKKTWARLPGSSGLPQLFCPVNVLSVDRLVAPLAAAFDVMGGSREEQVDDGGTACWYLWWPNGMDQNRF